MFKRITHTLIAIMMVGLLTGCGSSQTKSSQKKSYTVKSNYGTSSKSNGTQSSLTKPNSDYNSNSHATNCKKLGVSASDSDNKRLYSECASWLGTKYKYGGSSKSGTDCSGFTYMVYKAVYGKTLTRQSGGILSDNCTEIKKSKLREGDLVFFRTDGKRSKTPNHVGIYLKENKFIHASTSKGVVVSDLNQEYYVENWIAAGRVK